MICPRCNVDYPSEFFEDHHHKNHIHNDDSEENIITICVKCHKRHHFESGYDTVIIKKDVFEPKTLQDKMIEINREEFLKRYRERQSSVFNELIRSNKKLEGDIKIWIESNGVGIFDADIQKIGFEFKK